MKPYEWKIAVTLFVIVACIITAVVTHQDARRVRVDMRDARDAVGVLQAQVDFLAGRVAVLERVGIEIIVMGAEPVAVAETQGD